MSDTYKPSEHDGLRADGKPDQRMAQNNDDAAQFAHGKVDPHEAGKKGGQSSGDSGEGGYENNSSGGSAKGEFAHGKVDPVEAGRKGGQTS